MNTVLFQRLIRTCRPALAGLLLGTGLMVGELPAAVCTSLVLSNTDNGRN